MKNAMKVRITIELQKELYLEFKTILDNESRSLSKQVRNLIVEYIDTHNKTNKRIQDVYNTINTNA